MQVFLKTVTLFILMSFKVVYAQQDYQRVQGQFRASDLAKKQFGSPPTYEQSNGMNFGASINLGLKPTLDCGRIDIVTNFEAQFSKIREQFQGFLSDLPSYLSAAPMITLCCAPCQRDV